MFPATSSLKRTRSASTLNSTDVTLPKISGDLVLVVYTHDSLCRDAQDDNSRLASVGLKALEAAVTLALFKRKPMLKATDLAKERELLLSDEQYDKWVSMYGMRQKVRCQPDVVPSLMKPKETRAIFHAYVGAIQVDSGIHAVEEWITKLISPPSRQQPDPLPTTSTVFMTPSFEPPPPKKLKGEFNTPPPLPTFFTSSAPLPPPPPPSRYAQSPMMANPSAYMPPQSYFNPLSPAQPTLAFLPLFNQTATQRRVTVEYPAQFSGPSHAGKWTVQCVVNGIPKGMGTGGSKQIAKEEAARQAYYAMGWT